MLGLDTNLLLYASAARSPFQPAAAAFLDSISGDASVVVCELVLVEFYNLLRNPAVVSPVLTPAAAVARCQVFRQHPRWRIVETAPVMGRLWPMAAQPNFPRRRIFDLRLALTLQAFGVMRFATANVADFQGLGFQEVWNPLQP